MTARFGTDLGPVSAAALLAPALLDGLAGAILECQFLLLHLDRPLEPAAQVALAAHFGPVETSPSAPGQPETHPEVFRVAHTPGDGHTGVGFYWHTDGSYKVSPTWLSLLHAVAIDGSGGGTSFANLYDAYDCLPADRRREMARYRTVQRNGVIHPLVFRHPLTGRKALYLDVGTTAGLLDDSGAAVSPRRARHTVGYVNAVLEHRAVRYDHRWSVGDLLLYDNRCVAHKAHPSAPGARRVLHRVTVGLAP